MASKRKTGDNEKIKSSDDQEELEHKNRKHLKSRQTSKSTKKKPDCTTYGKKHHRECLRSTGRYRCQQHRYITICCPMKEKKEKKKEKGLEKEKGLTSTREIMDKALTIGLEVIRKSQQ